MDNKELKYVPGTYRKKRPDAYTVANNYADKLSFFKGLVGSQFTDSDLAYLMNRMDSESKPSGST
jgi:hypothetical protein